MQRYKVCKAVNQTPTFSFSSMRVSLVVMHACVTHGDGIILVLNLFGDMGRGMYSRVVLRKGRFSGASRFRRRLWG